MHCTAEASAGIAPPCFMQHFVTFPNDPQRYYFLTKDVEKWLVKEPSTGAGNIRSAAAAPNGSGGSPTKRSGKAPAAPASPSKATPKTSPSKKAKVAGKPW